MNNYLDKSPDRPLGIWCALLFGILFVGVPWWVGVFYLLGLT
jgi:hypothetical protein